MNNKILAFVLSFILVGNLVFAAVQMFTFKPGSEPTGFKNIRWGTNIDALPEMMQAKVEGPDYKGYKKRGDMLHVEGVAVRNILYYFWRGKLLEVNIEFEGNNTFEQLKKAMLRKYGSTSTSSGGSKSFLYDHSYGWRGYTTGIALFYTEKSQKGVLVIQSTKIGALKRKGVRTQWRQQRVNAVIAVVDIPKGSKITSGMVKIQQVDSKSVQTGDLKTIKEAVGTTAIVNIYKGRQINSSILRK